MVTRRRSKSLVCIGAILLLIYPQTETARDPQQWAVCVSNYCVCQSEEDCRHGCQGSLARRCMWRFALALFFGFAEITSQSSGAPLRCIQAKTKNSERLRCNRCAMVNRMYLLLLTLQDGVSTSKMSALSSTFKWQTRLKPTCIVLVSPSWVKMYFYGCFLGRTGRAGKLGTAITFLTNDDDEVMWVDACTYIFGWANVYLSLSFRSGTTSSKVRS